MSRKLYFVELTEIERTELESVISAGNPSAQKPTRPRILLKSDEGWSDPKIADALDSGRTTVQRMRERCSRSVSPPSNARSYDDREFLVDAAGYLTAHVRRELSGQLNYRERNHIEKWPQVGIMRIDRFHMYWRGSQSSARRWLHRFRHHYNHERPYQALNGRTPAEEIQN